MLMTKFSSCLRTEMVGVPKPAVYYYFPALLEDIQLFLLSSPSFLSVLLEATDPDRSYLSALESCYKTHAIRSCAHSFAFMMTDD